MFNTQGTKVLTYTQREYKAKKCNRLLTYGVSKVTYDRQELQDLVTNIAYYLIPTKPLEILHQEGSVTPLFALECILRRYRYYRGIDEQTSSRNVVELGFGNFFVGKSQVLVSKLNIVINYRTIVEGNKINTALCLAESCKVGSKLGMYYKQLINISPLLLC